LTDQQIVGKLLSMTTKKPAARVHRNIWGNHVCFLGREKVQDYGSLWDAKMWLARQIKAGHPVAKTSLIGAAEVSEFLELVE
jgi:hypothetical protein